MATTCGCNGNTKITSNSDGKPVELSSKHLKNIQDLKITKQIFKKNVDQINRKTVLVK